MDIKVNSFEWKSIYGNKVPSNGESVILRDVDTIESDDSILLFRHADGNIMYMIPFYRNPELIAL